MDNKITYEYDHAILQGRKCEHAVHPLILSRTSPKELTGEEMSSQELLSLFEASRWAPSFYNAQPWRFAYARRHTKHWDKFAALVWQKNLDWCAQASVLVLVMSQRWCPRKTDPTLEVANPTHSFDAGAACMALALEANARGLAVHCMAGFDYDRAYEVFGVQKDRDSIDCMMAIGKRPPLGQRLHEPRLVPRREVTDFVFEGGFDGVINDSNNNDDKNLVVK